MDNLPAMINTAAAHCRPDPAPLPDGVTRDEYCNPAATLETCQAVRLYLETGPGLASKSWIIWRTNHNPRAVSIRPISKKRITELRAGDRVRVGATVERVVGLEVFR